MTEWTNKKYQDAARSLICHAAWDLTETNPQVARSLYAEMVATGADPEILNETIRDRMTWKWHGRMGTTG